MGGASGMTAPPVGGMGGGAAMAGAGGMAPGRPRHGRRNAPLQPRDEVAAEDCAVGRVSATGSASPALALWLLLGCGLLTRRARNRSF